MDSGKKEYTFLWYVENYRYLWHKTGEALISPVYTADVLEGTVWTIELFPRGVNAKLKDYIALWLKRNAEGPENFPLKYELSFLAADGSTLASVVGDYTFTKGGGCAFPRFLVQDQVLKVRKADYLPQDTLTVCFKFWIGEGNIQPVTQISARTRIGIEHVSFYHIIKDFSAFEPNEKTIQAKRLSNSGLTLSSNLYFTDGSCCEEKIILEILPSDANLILSEFKLSLLNGSEKLIPCGEAVNRFDKERKDLQKLPLSLTRREILDNKSRYLPGDKFSLLCECTFTSGVEYQKIEKRVYDKQSPVSNNMLNIEKSEDIFAGHLSACPGALDDLKAIYNDQLFTDVKLKTKTESFPAHKSVLCARSSVFRVMMTNDMKEKNTDCIQIDDLDDGTVQQLLLFLYSDCLGDLDWDSAIKLYYAGDKYAVEKLKLLCSSFLVKNLSAFNAIEILLLADKHSDSYLKKAVEDFILKHEEQVYALDEWKDLIKTNPVLVSETMCKKYTRKI